MLRWNPRGRPILLAGGRTGNQRIALLYLQGCCFEEFVDNMSFALQILNLPNDQVVDKKTSKVDPKRVLSHILHELVRFKNADMYA